MYDPHLHLLIDDHEVLYRAGLTRFVEQPQRVSLEPVLKAGNALGTRPRIALGIGIARRL